MSKMHIWELWFPGAGATGLPFARARIDPQDVLWVHAAPATLAVTIRDGEDRVIARSESLERRGERFPMTRLSRAGTSLTREDRWPTADDLGAVVILCGGEAGILKSWWNAADGSEWRWQIEFGNHD